MKQLDQKTVVVTGAGLGLGRSIALLFAREGARVLAADFRPDVLDALKKEAADQGLDLETTLADMQKPAEIAAMIQKVVDMWGRLDILVNNAGIMDHFEPVADVSEELWERVIEVNLNGPFRAMKYALGHMLPRKSGNIINIASIAGLQGARAGAAYTSSKHALIGLTKNTGFMYATSGIRCNVIAAGAMATHITDAIDMQHLHPLATERIFPGTSTNPRTSNPDEVAAVALFLASGTSSFVNGSVVTADGGWIAY